MENKDKFARRLSIMNSIRKKVTEIDAEEAVDMLDAVAVFIDDSFTADGTLKNASNIKKLLLDLVTLTIPLSYGTEIYKSLQRIIIDCCEEAKNEKH